MQRPSTSRVIPLLVIAAIIASATLFAQQPTTALPVSAPTSAPVTHVSYAIPTDHPPTITYQDGRLSIVADNASLNQTLYAVSRATGMKITGNVADEHIFGTYGPDTPAKVLAELLDGTSVNVLILQNTSSRARNAAPLELVLSPRNGPPTPPDPHPLSFDNGPREPVRPSYPIAEPSRPSPANSVASTPAPAVDANGTRLTSGAAGGSSDSTDQQSPNGVKTPQQIYEELQRIRQLQQQQQQTQQGRP